MIAFELLSNYETNFSKSHDAIKHAIVKSNPSLLKELLVNLKLTENDKNIFLTLAGEILKFRRARQLDYKFKTLSKFTLPNGLIIGHRHKKSDNSNIYKFSAIITGLLGTCGFLVSEAWLLNTAIHTVNNDVKNTALKAALANLLITPLSVILISRKLFKMADTSREQHEQIYKMPKKKYLCAIEILAILQDLKI